jgi:hypothetical protein
MLSATQSSGSNLGSVASRFDIVRICCNYVIIYYDYDGEVFNSFFIYFFEREKVEKKEKKERKFFLKLKTFFEFYGFIKKNV